MVPITLYRNGFKLFSGPFRPFTAQDSISFITDLCDGYFPYELKDRYPNGVLFKLTDSTNKDYSIRTNETGNKSLDTNIRGMGSLAENIQQSTSQFLRKLPLSTIKNGRIVDVRKSIANATKNASSSPRSTNSLRSAANSHTPREHDVKWLVADTVGRDVDVVGRDMVGRDMVGRDVGIVSTKEVTHLKLKTHSGDTLLVTLHADDTMMVLRQTIDKYRNNNGMYEIRSTFPNKLHTDLTATLREADVMNTLLYIRDINR